MAEKVSYGIGQYRFHNSAACISEIGFGDSGPKPKYVSPPGSSSTMSSAYSDVCIKLPDNTTFDSGKDYHLDLAIPREIGFSHTVNVWLGNSNSPNGKIQPVRQIVVPPAAITGDHVHYVAIYASNPSSETQGPIDLDPSWINFENGVAKSITLPDGTENGTEYFYFNYAILTESWLGGVTIEDVVATFEMVFRPLTDGFDCVYLTLERTSDDYRVISSANGKPRIGHVINFDPAKGFKFVLHEMKQLNNVASTSAIPHRVLSRIGVWSRPGLMMAINGEEIRVGQSGYYELDAIPITSISVFAQDFANDNFSIDYQYIDSQS